MVETILVPTDGSDHAGKAVAFAGDIAPSTVRPSSCSTC